MQIGKREFKNGRTYVMGILNVTPDSFFDGGTHNDPDKALFHAEKLINDGADIIDVGGESTRPGHIQISDAEETERTARVIELIKSRFDISVSIDTYKSAVAAAAINAGADMVNDIWGFKYDSKMAELVKKTNTVCCLMHNRENADYKYFITDMKNDLAECIAIAKAAGIDRDKIVLDPGIGFAKTYEQNLEVMRNLKSFDLGYPLLLGTSNKSMIGNALNLPVTERGEGTLVTTVMAVQAGYMFVRVHDVKSNKRAIEMIEAIMKG